MHALLPTLAALLLAAAPASAAEPLWRYVTSDDGLQSEHLDDVAQSPDGSLWVGSHTGVWRWDGERAIRADGGAIRHRVTRVEVAGDGQVFALTEYGTLHHVRGASAPVVSDALGGVQDLNVDDDGVLYVLAGDVLWRREGARFAQTSVQVPEGSRVLRDMPGRDWLIGTPRAWWRTTAGAPEELLRQHNPWDGVVDEDGSYWLGDGLGRVVHLSPDGEALWHTKAASRVMGMVLREGVLWVACASDLLRIGPGHDLEVWGIEEDFRHGGRVLVDHESSLWVATFRGLAQLAEPDARLWTRRDGLPGEAVRFVERVDGRVWVSTWHGLGWVDLPDRGLASASTHSDRAPWVKGDGCADVTGRLWTHQESTEAGPVEILALDTSGGEVAFPVASPSFLLEGCARAADGSVWLSAGNDVFRALGEGPPARVAAWPMDPMGAYRVLHEDPTGRLWAGSGATICHAALDDGVVGSWTCERLPGAAGVRDIQGFADGGVWVTSQDSGVLRRGDDGVWEPIADVDLLPGTYLAGLAPSPRGGVWITGHAAVVRVEPTADGFVVQEELAAWLGHLVSGSTDIHEDPDGTLWVASLGGLVHVPPSARFPPTDPPRVALTQALVDGAPTEGDRLDLPRADAHVSLRFSATSYRAPRLLRYRMRVDGGRWSPPTDQTLFSFADLAPGAHQIEVAATLDGERWTTPPTSVHLAVPRPWYGRWELWAAVVAVVLGVIIGVLRLRFATQLRIERLRTRIAMDLHDEVGAGLGSVALLGGLVGRGGLPEPASREVGGRIARTATALSTSLRAIVWSLRPDSAHLAALGSHLGERARAILPELDRAGRLELDLPDEAAGRAMVDLEVLRAVQLAGLEALHNVARHAEASWARLALVREDARSWSLIVEDDGKGIPDDPDTPTDGGNGLPSLRARAESIGARVTLTRRPEGGTRVRLRFHPRRGWLGGWR